MPRARVNPNPGEGLFDRLVSVAIPVEQKLELLAAARQESAEGARRIDEQLLGENARLRTGLVEAKATQTQLAAIVEKLTAPPLIPAVVLAVEGSNCLVGQGPNRRVVQLAEGLDGGALESGEEVLLAASGNVIVGRSPYRTLSGGETAAFDRYVGARMILRSRDEEVVVDAVGAAARANWRPGDLARWERSLYIVTERIPRSEESALWIEETPRETFADIGGLTREIDLIRSALRLDVERPDVARKYQVVRAACILLCGPPGTGKTILARAVANWVATLAGDGRSRFMHVRPGEFANMWYGETERKWREAFRVAREAADRDPHIPVVVFLDELDAVAARRGRSATAVDDRVVCAIADELNGFDDRPNVCVLAATNRPDVLDPALTRPGGRFGDLQLTIPRPNCEAAREILFRHLSPAVPCDVSGLSGAEARVALVDAVLSRTYAPNATGEIARITFRDGSVRGILPRDLVSGASLAKIVRAAKHAAAFREAGGGSEGVRSDDLLSATEEELERSTSLLTASNIRAYVQDIPEDLDVVRVAPVRKKIRKAHRYLHVA